MKKAGALVAGLMLLVWGLSATGKTTQGKPLASWNDGATRDAIIGFVERVTAEGGPDFVPAEQRVATFDNDGTLWVEHPMYTQLVFALDRVHELAPQHPEWRTQEPFKSVLAGDLKAVASGGNKAIMELVAATHTGMTPDDFEAIVTKWTETATHPRFDHLYTQCVYQPMLELMDYLRANGFSVYIVSGGGIEFMRPWTERVYGVPRANVVGSSVKTKYEERGGKPVLIKQPELGSLDDGPGKPENISLHIGRRPIFAAGNSDGDFEMLAWTTAGDGPRFGLLVHHTDAKREYAYDRDTDFGKLSRALDAAPKEGWLVVDMAKDWKTIFPWE